MESNSKSQHRLVVGNGRFARHLRHWLTLKNLSFETWDRQHNSPLSAILGPDTIAYLATSDDSLPGLTSLILTTQPVASVVHFSGARLISGARGAHPLMTFAEDLLTEGEYDRIPFVIDWLQNEETRFSDAFPGFPNSVVFLEPTQKPLYHALLVLLGNLPAHLLREAAPTWQGELNLGLEALQPFLTQSLANGLRNPQSRPTGPWTRGDVQTIQEHVNALGKMNPKLARIYSLVANEFAGGSSQTFASPKEVSNVGP